MPSNPLEQGISWLIRQEAFAQAVQAIPGGPAIANRFIIKRLVRAAPPRPMPFSLWTPQCDQQDPSCYVSWTGLFDRRYTARHLPPDEAGVRRQPAWEALQPLFLRQGFRPSVRSSALFAFFAQWFTEAFLRTSPLDPRRTTSNHEIDLAQIYGLTAEVTAALREPGSGRLRTRRLGRRLGEAEFPARLFGDDGALQPGLAGLPYLPDDPATVDLTPLGRGHPLPPPKGEMRTVDVLLRRLRLPEPDARARWQRLHATGLETGNATLLHAAINTILIRQHNRACDMLRQDNPGWDQDRVFETARATTLVALLRLVVNEYINHIAGLPFRLSLDRSFAERQGWYRTNRISVEFNLLYRWHSAVPDPLVIGDRRLHWQEYGMNPALMEELGPERIIAAASRQRAGQIGLRNTPEFLLGVDQASIAFGRATRVQPYNAYRRHFGLDPYRSFAELTGDPDLAAQLEALYGQVDDVELVVGLLAEKPYPPALFGQLMLVMVGSDAFTHILTNPLLAGRVYEACFSEASQRLIEGVTSLQGLVEANAQGVPRDEVLASFTAAD